MGARAGIAAAAAWLALALAIAASAGAAPILRPDPSFGNDGLVEPHLPGGYGYTSFLSAEVEPDGSILAGRHGKNSGDFGTILRRYGADGSLDRSIRSQPSAESTPEWSEVALPLPDGKSIVATAIRRVSNLELEEVVISRLDREGRPDPFGKDGEVDLEAAFDVKAGEFVGIARHGEGVIVLLDEAQGSLFEGQVQEPGGSTVLALGADGRLDPAYGDAGEVHSGSSIVAFAEGADGSLLIAGDEWGSQIGDDAKRRTSDIYAERLTPAGAPDPSFGQGGVVSVDFGGLDLAETMLLGADGSVTIGGSTVPTDNSICPRYESFCSETPVLARLLPSGAPDPSFGEGGEVRLAAIAEPNATFGMGRGVRTLTALPGGGLLAGGGSGTAAFLAELGPSGALVSGFGRGGVVVERDRQHLTMKPVALGTDGSGRIYVAAATNTGALFSFEDTAIFRFMPDGRLDRGYGHGSGFARVPSNARGMVVRPGGDIYLLGTDRIPSSVEHVEPDGALDRSFGEDGVALIPDFPKRPGPRRPQFQEFRPRSIAVAPDGGVVVGGESNIFGGESRIALLRFDRSGHLDPSFGKRGFKVLTFGATGECNMTELKVSPQGRILIAARIHDRGEYGRRPALIQLLADGSPDPAFGKGGAAPVELGHEGVGKSLRLLADGSILLSGRQDIDGSEKPLLLKFDRHGSLDRAFAKAEGASVRASSAVTSERGAVEILVTPGRIFTVEKYGEVFAFSPRGALEAAIPVEAGNKPRRSLRAGALRRGKLLLLGLIGDEGGLFLRRYLP